MAVGPESTFDDFRDFAKRAQEFLDALTPAQLTAALDETTIAWHPTGFIVAYTNVFFDGAPVRVHCWPSGHRQLVPDHPTIHNHAWHLCSRVLAGVYVERRVDLEVDLTDSAELEVYSVEYHGRLSSTIRPSGSRLRVASAETESYTAGDCHALPAGSFHETLVPPDAFAVTAMATSAAKLISPALAGSPSRPPRASLRAPSDKRLILEHLSFPSSDR